jgi:hypothetical protein
MSVNPDTKQVAYATEKSSWINEGKREKKGEGNKEAFI